jgi:hypothetical protein
MTLARAMAVGLYGFLFRLLIMAVPKPEELDLVLRTLDGEGDERIL